MVPASWEMSICAGALAREDGLGLVSVQIGLGVDGMRSSVTCLIVSSLTGATPWLMMAVTALPRLLSLMCEMMVSASWVGSVSLMLAAFPPSFFCWVVLLGLGLSFPSFLSS